MKSKEVLLEELKELEMQLDNYKKNLSNLSHEEYEDIMRWQDIYMEDYSYNNLGKGTRQIQKVYASRKKYINRKIGLTNLKIKAKTKILSLSK